VKLAQSCIGCGSRGGLTRVSASGTSEEKRGACQNIMTVLYIFGFMGCAFARHIIAVVTLVINSEYDRWLAFELRDC